jgi:2-C-methyl-D-erythritol 4-phosphate cytidylyltransferase
MKKYAIIVAGGRGTRMGSELPKQFLLVNGKPVLYFSLKTFLEAYDDIEIILVLPLDFENKGRLILDEFFPGKKIMITGGGDTRFQSVKNGLQFVKRRSIVFVHDAARCLVSTALIHRCYEVAMRSGNAIPAILSKDSVRIKTEHGNKRVDRDHVMLVQTPQTFQSDILLKAYQTEFREAFTDEATVAESTGISINLVEGEENNFKITGPADLWLAGKIMSDRDQ